MIVYEFDYFCVPLPFVHSLSPRHPSLPIEFTSLLFNSTSDHLIATFCGDKLLNIDGKMSREKFVEIWDLSKLQKIRTIKHKYMASILQSEKLVIGGVSDTHFHLLLSIDEIVHLASWEIFNENEPKLTSTQLKKGDYEFSMEADWIFIDKDDNTVQLIHCPTHKIFVIPKNGIQLAPFAENSFIVLNSKDVLCVNISENSLTIQKDASKITFDAEQDISPCYPCVVIEKDTNINIYSIYSDVPQYTISGQQWLCTFRYIALEQVFGNKQFLTLIEPNAVKSVIIGNYHFNLQEKEDWINFGNFIVVSRDKTTIDVISLPSKKPG